MSDNQPISEQYARAGLDWADKEAAASILEDTRSAHLAEMVTKVIEANPGMALNRAESTVKASPEWREYVTSTVEARRVANRAKIKLDYLRMRAQEEMSRAANERLVAKL